MMRKFSKVRIFRRNKPVHIRRRELLRLPDFKSLTTGQFSSQAADAATTILTAQFVFFSSQSGPTRALLVQSVLSAAVPLFLAGPLSGILADKFSRQSILVRGQFVRSFLCVILLFAGLLNLKWLVLALFGMGLCLSKVLYTVRVSTIRHVVRQHELVAADSFLLTVGNVAATTGGICGVFTLQFFELGGLLVVIVGHLVSAGQYRRIKIDLGGGKDHISTDWKTIFHSFLYVKTRYAFLAVGSHRFIYGVSFACLALLVDSNASNSYAALVGAAGLGTFTGNLTSEWVNEHLPRKSTTVLVFIFSSLAVMACAISPRIETVLVAISLLSFMFQNLRVCSDATVQRYAPRGAGGRVLASYDLICNASFLTGLLAGLMITSHANTVNLLVSVSGGYAAMSALFGLLTRRIPIDSTSENDAEQVLSIPIKASNREMIPSQSSPE